MKRPTINVRCCVCPNIIVLDFDFWEQKTKEGVTSFYHKQCAAPLTRELQLLAKRIKSREHYRLNRERILAREKEEYQQNKEKFKQRSREYDQKNKEKRQKWRDEHKPKYRIYHAKYRAEHREKRLKYNAEYYLNNQEKLKKAMADKRRDEKLKPGYYEWINECQRQWRIKRQLKT